jgi:hypothetical protein
MLYAPKPPKVVPIQEKRYQLIAKDTNAKRIILGIGGGTYSHRLAQPY